MKKNSTNRRSLSTLSQSSKAQSQRRKNVEKYPDKLIYDMREIYKAILQRIVDTGETQESDILFMKLYKTEFEQNTPLKGD